MSNQWAELEQKFLSLAIENASQPRLADHYTRLAARASQEKNRALLALEKKQTSRDRRLIAIRKWN